MSDLDKMARKIKAARKEYEDASEDQRIAFMNWQEAQKAQNAAAQALSYLRGEFMTLADPIG